MTGIQTHSDALGLIGAGDQDLTACLFAMTAKCLKRIWEPKNKDIVEVIYSDANPVERVRKFNKLLAKPEVLKRLIRIFPIVATTCISAHKLGTPEPAFDMAIIDEASQCLTATALMPIIRGQSLMLVGDPQQLRPVTLLDADDNASLRANYRISDEYLCGTRASKTPCAGRSTLSRATKKMWCSCPWV